MLHACAQRFDVMETVENFLETKRGLTRLFHYNGLWPSPPPDMFSMFERSDTDYS